jgi:hypothetical protein
VNIMPTLNTPIFITAVYRSGSNLLAHLLDRHPRLSIWSDCVHYFRFMHDRYLPLELDGNIDALVCDLADRLKYRFGFTLDTRELINRVLSSSRTQASVYNAIMTSPFFLRDKKRWGEKVSLAWTRIDDFLNFFPQGKALVILRDPRAIVTSWKKETIAPPPLYLDALFNCLGLYRYLQRRSGNRNLYILRFEDLVYDPANVMNEVFTFLGEEPLSQYSVSPMTHDPDKAKTLNTFTRNNNSDNFIDASAANRWMEQIDPFDLSLCNALLDPFLPLHGYTVLTDQRATNSDMDVFFFNSPEYLKHAYRVWRGTGAGHERYPLDPTNAANWHPASSKTGELKW